MARVRMYTTAVCPFCQMAERLLQAKGAEIEKSVLTLTRPNARR